MEEATLVLALALAVTLVVERLLELLKNAFDLVDSWAGWHAYWTWVAHKKRKSVERELSAIQFAHPLLAPRFLARHSGILLGPEHGYDGQVPVVVADFVRAVRIGLAAKLLGIALGVILALVLNLNLLAAISRYQPAGAFGTVLSGAVLGLAAAPLHRLLRSLERHGLDATGEATHG